jgi:hypothetical protein
MNFGIAKSYVQKLKNYECVKIGMLEVNEIFSVFATLYDEHERNSLWKSLRVILLGNGGFRENGLIDVCL